MIKRQRIFEKTSPYRDAQKIYIFCEGEKREFDYFNFFVEISSNLEIIPIPPEDSKSDPEKLLEQSEELFLKENSEKKLDYKEGDLIWFVIDTDNWEKDGKIATLREFCTHQNHDKKYIVWNVAQSNPCFEIWLYYHIFNAPPLQSEVGKFRSMKDFVDANIKGGFNSRIHPTFIDSAIKNSRFNYKTDKSGCPTLFATEVFKLGDIIWKYAKNEILRKTNKMR